MWCYRRFGHNEGDEPSFTQPLMYAKIRQHPPVSAVYSARLEQEKVVDRAWVDQTERSFVATLDEEFEAAKSYLPNKADWFGGRWEGLGRPTHPRRSAATSAPPSHPICSPRSAAR